MKLAAETKKQIARNLGLTLLIYVLPIALMFITFKITGQRPWEKKHQPVQHTVNSSTTNQD